MKNIIFGLLFLAFHLAPIRLTFAQNHSTNTDLLETLVADFLEKSQLPGMSVAVSKNGALLYSKGFGYADVKRQIPMSTSSRIRTASVAKVITATALGRLATEGKLDFDAPIKNYVPYIQADYAELTTRQLAGHTSGLAHQAKGWAYKKKQYQSIQESVGLLNSPLLFSPGSDYKYSTFAYNLLAAVIEGASGKTYTKYLAEEIFTPLKMKNTAPENIKNPNEADTPLYFFRKGKLNAFKKPVNGSYKLAGAGFRSTAEDLVKMMEAYDNGFLSAEVVQDMFQSGLLTNGKLTQVGIGWRRSFDAFGQAVIEHAGSWQGARTVIVYYPEERLSIALMINAKCQILIEETAHILAQLFLAPASTPPLAAFSQTIEITEIKSNGETEKYPGQLSLNGQQGQVKGDGKGALKNTRFYYLGFGDHYAAVSPFGLLYLKWQAAPIWRGGLYIYGNRNVNDPTSQPAMYAFRGIE